VRKSSSLLIAVVAVGAVVLSACSSSSKSSGSAGSTSASSSPSAGTSAPSSAAPNAALIALVPAKIKSAGKLVVGVNQPYAPNEYLDPNGKLVGFDLDLLDATAKVLGLTTSYKQADFDKIIPAITAGTYDVGMSSFTDTKEREKTVDFATYFSAGILWASPTGKTVDPDNACGLKVAVQTTTTEDTDDIPTRSKACTTAGKKAIQKIDFDSQDDATNAVILGKADAMSADSPVTAYAIKQAGGKLQAAGSITEAAPYGWPVAKGSTLAKALQGALQTLITNGSYNQICTKWGVQSGEIKTSAINGAIS
jgi:polar amino acid transport system substrate-binding protein